MPAVFNASNEVAVEAFMKNQIPFTSIIDVVATSAAKLSSSAHSVIRDISDVSAVEEDARQVARELVKGSSK
jgi:1-deoxy-D-xylulose-5-phosphate reductoisomerase